MAVVSESVEQRRAQLAGLARAVNCPDGGFTYDVRAGERVSAGYAVAVCPEREREQQIDGPVRFADLLAYALQHAEVLARPGYVMGGWRDARTGRAYLDVSVVVGDRREAARLATEYEQLAFFDLGAGREVRMP